MTTSQTLPEHSTCISSTAIYDKEEPIIYTLKKNSRKYAFPIRENEIELSNGAMQQNIY